MSHAAIEPRYAADTGWYVACSYKPASKSRADRVAHNGRLNESAVFRESRWIAVERSDCDYGLECPPEAMEAHMTRIATLLGVSLMTALPLTSAMAQQPSPAAAPQGQQAVLVGSDSLVGSAVRDGEGREIGKVNRLMIDPSDGRISSVIVATGGTLGVGSNMISVPWSSVKVGQERGKVIVTTGQMLESAPSRASAPAEQQRKQ